LEVNFWVCEYYFSSITGRNRGFIVKTGKTAITVTGNICTQAVSLYFFMHIMEEIDESILM
jgi:hypothetical protein